MVTHEAWLTKLFNAYLAGFGNWLLALFHQKAANPEEPWADFMVMQILVAVILIAVFAALRSDAIVSLIAQLLSEVTMVARARCRADRRRNRWRAQH